MRVIVTKRVIERGTIEDFYSLLNLYGVENVKKAIMQIPWLSDKDMNFAAKIFNIKKEELLYYIHGNNCAHSFGTLDSFNAR